MRTQEKKPNPEREQTDESLRVERAKADADFAEQLAALEETADAVTEKARARADSVLAAARAKKDRESHPLDAPSAKAIHRERVREDQALKEERASADETLRVERSEQATLHTVERDETDHDLSLERSRSDDSVSARDAFLGIVSHDLRNMLHGMIGFASLIANGVSSQSDEDQVVQHARRIQRTGMRMNRLVGDLVDVASIEAGALAVRREVGDPTAVVTEAVEAFQAQAAANGVSLAAEVPSPVPAVAFDAARILQVLTNLLSNALKFTPRKGRVVVLLEEVEDAIRISVCDSGVGIAPGKLAAIFERFVQGDENDRRGVGLGLYISKCIMQGHSGRIWVESKLGEGSKFCFTLPLAADA